MSSQFPSSHHFELNHELFSIFPFAKIGRSTDAAAVSNHVCVVTLFSNGDGIIWKLTRDELTQSTTLEETPLRIETNGSNFFYIRADGMIVSPTTASTLRILSSYRLSKSTLISSTRNPHLSARFL
jgi:hypothetical protein